MQLCLLLALLSCLYFVSADNYHRDDEESQQRTRFSSRKGFEEESASYWRLQAQKSLFQRLEKKLDSAPKAKNVIFFIGDGMDLATVAATRMYLGGEEKVLSFEKFEKYGLSKTYCIDRKVPDSACTATAYLGGVKTNYGVIGLNAKVARKSCEGMDQPENFVFSIAKWAQDAGKGSGIVTTTRITHASPAGVYAHVSERDWESDSNLPSSCKPLSGDIAHQLVHGETGKNLDVALGCGSRSFLRNTDEDDDGKKGNRKDGRNLVEEWQELQREAGRSYRFVYNKTGLLEVPSGTQRLFGLFESDHCQYQLDIRDKKLVKKPSLTEMTEAALKVLSSHEKGYFLFVEGGRIDHAHHANRLQYSLDELAEMDRAIKRVLELTDPAETLIVVSADHGHTLMYNGYATRSNGILGLGGVADDDLPWATMSYVTGPGYPSGYNFPLPGRKDLTKQDMTNPSWRFPSTVMMGSATHGGGDVGIWATGPGAHLFQGVLEQNALPHLMAHVAQIGPYYVAEKDGSNGSSRLVASSVLMFVVLLRKRSFRA